MTEMSQCQEHPTFYYYAPAFGRCPRCFAEDESIPLATRLRNGTIWSSDLAARAADELNRLAEYAENSRAALETARDELSTAYEQRNGTTGSGEDFSVDVCQLCSGADEHQSWCAIGNATKIIETALSKNTVAPRCPYCGFVSWEPHQCPGSGT